MNASEIYKVGVPFTKSLVYAKMKVCYLKHNINWTWLNYHIEHDSVMFEM